jgi:surface polysaccharide O-acyltransferase-like enzyme
MAKSSTRARRGRFLSDYGLGVALAAIFVVTMLMHTWSGWMVYANEQLQHSSNPVLWGNDGYIWMWLENTFQNWQSEFLQMLATVVLTTFLIHRHSQQSADEMDVMNAKIDHIEALLEDQFGEQEAK